MPVDKRRDVAGTASGARQAELAALADELDDSDIEPVPVEPEPVPVDPEPAAPVAAEEPEPASSASPVRLSVASDDARETLRRLGAARGRLIVKLADADTALFIAIRQAHDAEVPKLTIAKDAGVSRQTVYNVLGR